MRIGLSGTVSVGKSTLIKELAKLEQFKDYHIATERSKYLRDLGIPLNTDSTVFGQFIFIAERASELMYENLLTDRSIWDVCAFTLSSKTIKWDNRKKLVEASELLMDYYDVIFYISPEGIELEDNQIRCTDPIYRDKIDYSIKSLLAEYPPKKLINIQGTTEERIKIILEHIST